MSPKKKLALANLKNTYARLMPSKIEGVGVFAVRDIPPNIKVFKGMFNQRWYKFKMSELKNLDKEVLKMIDDFFVVEKDDTVTIPLDGLNALDASFFVNHSKKPNLKTIDNGFTFISARKIKKGEELTVAYNVYDYKYR